MEELGDLSKQLHCELAEHASTTGIDKFYLIGSYALAMKEVIGKRAQCFESKALLVEQLCKELVIGETVLVKGSRSSAMDEVVELIKRRVL
jgi:UDP-N-acetylmuramoyl-tripeptide--D-alanyl-D-alanine ligase